MGGVGEWLLVGLLAAFVLFRGLRRRAVTRVSLLLDAPADVVWDTYHSLDADVLTVVGFELDREIDADTFVVRYRQKPDHRIRCQYLERAHGQTSLSYCRPDDGAAETCKEYWVRISLTPQATGKTRLEAEYDIHYARPWQGLVAKLIPKAATRHMLAKIAAQRQIAVAPASTTIFPRTPVSLTLAALAAAGFAVLVGPVRAALLMIYIAVHELGHVLAARALGDRGAHFQFVPLVGGVALSDTVHPASGLNRIAILLAGPVIGAAPALVALGLWFASANPWYLAVAADVAFFNLFNLLPIYPLDGGRCVVLLADHFGPGAHRAALAGSVVLVGGLLVLALQFVTIGPYLALIFALLALALWVAWKTTPAEAAKSRIGLTGLVAGTVAYAVSAGMLLALLLLPSWLGHDLFDLFDLLDHLPGTIAVEE